MEAVKLFEFSTKGFEIDSALQ